MRRDARLQGVVSGTALERRTLLGGKPMSANQPNALSKLKFDAQTRKRAQWESFEFSVPAAGSVAVSNASYGDEKDDHTHAVNVEDGVPIGCSCKADEYQPGACKHRLACAINAPVLAAASASRSAEKRALADGGMVSETKPQGTEALEGDEDEPCVCELDPDGLGCFEHFEVSEE